MRKFWLFLFTLFLLPLVSAQAEAGSTPMPKLKVEGSHLATQNGTHVTLRGVSLCSLEWHKPLQQIEQITRSPLKWDANVLRLPVQVKEWNRVGAGSYIKNYLDPAVALCKQNNIYCIIDWHQIGPWKDPKVISTLTDFWKRVAPRYASNPNILYEVFNEPMSPGDMTKENWAAWKASAQVWVDMIRRDAPDTVILIGSPHWSQMPQFAAADPFKGDNLAYVMHLYPNWKQEKWDKLFGNAADTVPIFITEWGWSATPKNKKMVFAGNAQTYGTPLRTYLDQKPHINWTAWSYDPACGPAMLGADKDMAAFVKAWLAEHNGQ